MAVPELNEEFCPNCGDWVPAKLFSYRHGFCRPCALPHQKRSRLEAFLEANADHIEHYMVQGHDILMAISMVRAEVRPICVCCGVPMKRARRDAIFCSRTKRCISARKRYEYLVYVRKFTKAEALADVTGEK